MSRRARPAEDPRTLERPGPAPARGRGTRLRALDALRLVAALSVAVYHYLAIEDAAPAWGQDAATVFPRLDAVAPYGWLGVEVFFVISGFVICLSCWGRTLGDFFRSRVSRLYPAYWVAVALTFLALVLTPAVAAAPSPWEALVNLTMLQDPLGVPRMDTVYWTLWAELRFYLLFAFVVWRGLTYRRVIAFALVWTLAVPVAESAGTPLLTLVVMPSSAPYFLVGIGLYLVHRFGHQLLTWLVVGANLVLSLHYAIIRMVHQSEDIVHRPLHGWVVAALFLSAVLLVHLIGQGRLSWVRWRWVTVAGALTYPFYLLHERIGFSLVYWLYQRAGLSAYLVLPGTVVAVLVLAWLVHRFVERPVSRWMRVRLQATGAFTWEPPDLVGPAPRAASDAATPRPVPSGA